LADAQFVCTVWNKGRDRLKKKITLEKLYEGEKTEMSNCGDKKRRLKIRKKRRKKKWMIIKEK